MHAGIAVQFGRILRKSRFSSLEPEFVPRFFVFSDNFPEYPDPLPRSISQRRKSTPAIRRGYAFCRIRSTIRDHAPKMRRIGKACPRARTGERYSVLRVAPRPFRDSWMTDPAVANPRSDLEVRERDYRRQTVSAFRRHRGWERNRRRSRSLDVTGRQARPDQPSPSNTAAASRMAKNAKNAATFNRTIGAARRWNLAAAGVEKASASQRSIPAATSAAPAVRTAMQPTGATTVGKIPEIAIQKVSAFEFVALTLSDPRKDARTDRPETPRSPAES